MATVTYLKTVSDKNLHTIIQRIANLLNKDITVHSGDRNFVPPGGSTDSLHLANRAADFHISGMSDADGFAFIKRNMNKIFDATQAYEFIHHGFYTGTGTQNPQTGAGGQHLHLGHYGNGGYVTFKVEGLTRATKNHYTPTKVFFSSPNGTSVQPEQASTYVNPGANGSPVNISKSVGKYGKNQHRDVRLVQYLLNLARRNMTEAHIPFQKFNRLVEDSFCGELTIRAITIFQRDIMGWRHPDGRVDAGGKTLQMLYIAAYNPSDATLRRLNRARIMMPETSSQEWNGILAWGNYKKSSYITENFITKTIRICRELGIKNPGWLMTVMAFETGRTFAPNKKNAAGSSGTGLIQFMKETIDGRVDKRTGKFVPGLGEKLGITHSQLAGMTAENQLDVVKAYFQQFGNRAARAADVDDLYFLVLLPSAFGQPDDATMFQSGTKAYTQNKGLDTNKDGWVSVSETAQTIRAMFQEGLGKYGLGIKNDMRQNILTLLCFAVFGLLCASSNAFAQKPLLAAVNNYIGKQEISLEAAEYPKARKIIRADLDGDGDKDAAVQYTLEGFAGGNNWSQMLAVFRNDKGVYKFAAEDTVGGKFSDRMFILKKVVGRKIYAATQSCPEIPQGICRNPKKGQAIFAFRKGKLQEL